MNMSASLIQNIAHLIRGANATDTARMACSKCQQQIDQLSTQMNVYSEECKQIRMKVLEMKKDGLTVKDSKMRHMLTKSTRTRTLLQQTIKKREALEQTVESINTTQVNQNIFATMQQTTKALKQMGVDVDNCDTVMLDMEGHMSDIQNIQNALGQPLETPDEDNLLEELNEILDDSNENLNPPSTTNMMPATQHMDSNTKETALLPGTKANEETHCDQARKSESDTEDASATRAAVAVS